VSVHVLVLVLGHGVGGVSIATSNRV